MKYWDRLFALLDICEGESAGDSPHNWLVMGILIFCCCWFYRRLNKQSYYRWLVTNTHWRSNDFSVIFSLLCATCSLQSACHMITSSNGNIFALAALCEGNPSVTVGLPSQRPVTRSFDVFFDACLNKRLSKQSRDWPFETPWHSLWRHCKDTTTFKALAAATGNAIF